MAATYSIAVIGDWESVMGFRALGLDTYPVTSVEEARKTVHNLAKTDCAVIYLTETLAKDMIDVLDRYKDEIQPAIILIPGREGSLGIGRANIQSAIERARQTGACLETALLVPPQAALQLFPPP